MFSLKGKLVWFVRFILLVRENYFLNSSSIFVYCQSRYDWHFFVLFLVLFMNSSSLRGLTKGQWISGLIYEVIVSPKIWTEKFKDFCSVLCHITGQKSIQVLVHIFWEKWWLQKFILKFTDLKRSVYVEMPFWCLQFSQKMNLKTQIFALAYSFIFWENWKKTKCLFVIDWPLAPFNSEYDWKEL